MSTLSSTTTDHDHGVKAPSHIAPGEIAVGVVVGRASEYFDFFVYGIASALIFPAVFFPFVDRLQGTLYAFAIFALAFIARPFGTLLFTWIQSRWGLGTKLTVALFLLGTATAGIAFVPSFGTLGAAAIVLLACFRTLQGVALGGSWDGLPSLLALNAPKERRGWYAMLGQLGAPIGFIVAASVFAFLYASLSEEDLLAWGWRYPSSSRSRSTWWRCSRACAWWWPTNTATRWASWSWNRPRSSNCSARRASTSSSARSPRCAAMRCSTS